VTNGRAGAYATGEVCPCARTVQRPLPRVRISHRADPRACPHWARLRRWSAVAATLSCCRIV